MNNDIPEFLNKCYYIIIEFLKKIFYCLVPQRDESTVVFVYKDTNEELLNKYNNSIILGRSSEVENRDEFYLFHDNL